MNYTIVLEGAVWFDISVKGLISRLRVAVSHAQLNPAMGEWGRSVFLSAQSLWGVARKDNLSEIWGFGNGETEMKHTLAALLVVLILAPAAFAIPAIQLYIPGSTYDFRTETWVIESSSFELWVVTSSTDTRPLHDLTLVAAIAPNQRPIDNALTIGGSSFLASDYESGAHLPPGHRGRHGPRHGLYPTQYVEVDVSPLVSTATQSVMNYAPGSRGTGVGEIFRYQVTSAYDWVHFDAYGYRRGSEGRIRFAPFSHDAGAITQAIPEPASLLLFGLGLSVAGLYKLRRHR